ncbi:MAG: signal recognition particle protein [Candidatus Edwardsbacteria bacterium]
MFEQLSAKFQIIFRKLQGYGRISSNNIRDSLHQVKLALLEADVNYQVVKEFLQNVEKKAIGTEVLESVTPGQQLIKIVYEELVKILGERESGLQFLPKGPTVLMLVGLQGTGKTTTAVKLGKLIKKKGKVPLLIAADTKRPAAAEQLKILSEKAGLDFFTPVGAIRELPLHLIQKGIEKAETDNNDVIILDTAGRLHIDEEMMQELSEIKRKTKPLEILLIADAMTGQDAVNIAKIFDQQLNLTGIILAKLDGDARGGAALSIRAVTGKPIKFVGVGERIDDLELFYPERMAERILGFGDILTLVEKAQTTFDERESRKLEEKIRKESLTLQDFLQQIRQIKKMGSLEEILAMIPDLSSRLPTGFKIDEKEHIYFEAIINSMTPEERQKPWIIDGSRRKRIARGSGTSVQQVNQLLRNFEMTQKMMKEIMSRDITKQWKKYRRD